MNTHVECPDCGRRCDDCDERMCPIYGPGPADTCEVHHLCWECDRVGDNTCTECARVRRES